MSYKKTILHLINGLGMGGAEKNLIRIVEKTSSKYNHVIITLTNQDFYSKRLKEKGIKVIKKDLKNIFFMVFRIFLISYEIFKIKPDIIHTWLYASDLIGGIIGKLLGVKTIIWSIRHDIGSNSPFSEKILVKTLAVLSYFIPDLIISCSETAAVNHINFGYKKNKVSVINNGVDIELFKPNQIVKKNFLEKNNIKKEEIIFGMIARFAKVKNHLLLFSSLSKIKNKFPFKCILIGDKISHKNKALVNLIRKFDLKEEIIISEDNKKVYEIFSIIDICILTSFSECFPNVLIESMASGTPCVSTNVGDAKKILSNTGWIINDFSYLTLAKKLEMINQIDKNYFSKMGKICRQRVINYYSIEKMILSYNAIYNGFS